jgi:carboxypeptidase Taq
MADAQQTFDSLCDHARQTAVLSSVQELCEWDERTYMPDAAGGYRAEQITLLAGMLHDRRTDPRLGEWLAVLADSDLASDPLSDTATTIREMQREYDKSTKLPKRLIEELARVTVLGQQAWQTARAADDFATFAPLLTDIVRLKREEAQTLAMGDCLYDGLLDDFEPHEKTADVTRVLGELRDELARLVAEVADSGRAPNRDILARDFPVDRQAKFGKMAAAAIGFDFKRGRLDETTHPFCTGLGPNDCRLTTRYRAHDMADSLFSTLHEAGHGIYDQGLRSDWYGLPPGSFVSLGIHESQSRMWENLVGRSHAFWQHFFPQAQKAFPSGLGDVTLDEFYWAVNDVRPSLIRTESDEATYNLHIIARFELEQALLEDELQVADLPGAWNEKYQTLLGISPPNDANGVLQDIHWSGGAIGYFPTYTLGNLYASQFFAAADKALGGLHEMFARGEFTPLREWLVANIHASGQCRSAAELVQHLTGEPLSHGYLIAHLREKLGALYGVSDK